MRVKEMRELTLEEITAQVAETRKEIVSNRFKMAARKLESPAKLKLARKKLARLLTIETEKISAEIEKVS